MKTNNQWRHWWQFTVAVGLKWLDGLAVNNEWGASWLISKVVSSPDTQLAFQWGFRHRRHRGNEKAHTSCPAGQDGREDVCRLKSGLQEDQGRWGDCGGDIGEESRHPSLNNTPCGWQLRCISGLFCTWRRRANDEENKKIKQQKGATSPAASVSSSSSLSVAPPNTSTSTNWGCSLIG